MTKLSDTQALILSAAAQRPEHIALPLPESLRGGAAAKVVGAMLAKGFLEESTPTCAMASRLARPATPRHHAGRHRRGLAAIGIEPATRTRACGRDRRAEREPRRTPPPNRKLRPRRAHRAGNEAGHPDRHVARRTARPSEIMAATGWQSHTVRGAIAGALKKKPGSR